LFGAVCLSSGTALAVPVTEYITVQPIDVCGAVCAPVNNKGLTSVGAVGFIDPSGVNVTRAVWNQIGVDVTYMPTVRYVNGSFLTLPVDPNSNPLTSTVFKTLSQQDAISTGTVPNPTNPPGVPVSQNATTINAFFVGTVNPITPPGGTLFGFGWVNNNGVTVAANSLTGLGARPDTLAHEIGHTLDLDHGTFGAGPNASGGCDAACAANLMTTGLLRTQPTTSNPLGTLGTTTDQLNQMQQSQVLLSGFMNPIAGVSGTVSAPPTAAAAVTFAAATAASTTSFPFHVSFDALGRPGEFLSKLTLQAPEGVFFKSGTFFASLATVHGRILAGGTELELDFDPHTFVFGDSLDYTIGVCHSGDEEEGCSSGRSDLLLKGGTYTYLFETDNALETPVELFQTTSDLVGVGGGIEDLTSSSLEPDLMIASQILNPTTFVGFGALPCTPVGGSCPPLVLADADPAEEGTLPAPEPPSIAILFAGLGFWLVLGFRHRRHGRAVASYAG
jgi:hypothetical protein